MDGQIGDQNYNLAVENWAQFQGVDRVRFLVGSSSLPRLEIATKVGFACIKSCAPHTSEKTCEGRDKSCEEDPRRLVEVLGKAKAADVLSKIEGNEEKAFDVMMTGDQVTVFKGLIMEKPQNKDEATLWLRTYGKSQIPLETIGSIVLTDIKTGIQVVGIDKCSILISPPLNESEIEEIIRGTEECCCLHSAGALVIESPVMSPHVNILEGSYDGVRGLPTKLLLSLLEDLKSEVQRKTVLQFPQNNRAT